MTDVIYIKTGEDWIDVTDYVLNFSYNDKGTSALNKIVVSFKKDIIETTENPSYQREIKWEFNGTDIFGGKIEKPESDFPILIITAYSYGQEFLDKYVNEVFTSTTPEAIAQSVIETDTDLTYASTTTTGINIGLIPFRDKKKSEVLSFLSNLTNYSFFTDTLKNAYFEPVGITDSGLTLTVGTNVLAKPTWDYNPDWVISKVIIEGDFQDFNTSESFAGPAADFVLAKEPGGNIKVTVAGTEKIGKIEGSNDGDYTVDKENKTISFGSAQSTVIVYYTYKIPIRVEQAAQTNYTHKELKIKNKSIKSYTEARKLGRDIISLRSTPKKGTTLNVYGFHANLKTGYLIKVIDEQETDENGESISESFQITEVKYSGPDGIAEIKVGTNDYMLYDLLRDIDSKINELLQNDSNRELVQNYRLFIDNVEISLTHSVDTYIRNINDSWIWGVSLWGTGTWGDRRDGDDFKSYTGSYSITDFWTLTGSYSPINNELYLDSGATAEYKGRNETGSFNISKGKVILDYNKDTSNSLELLFNKTSSTTYNSILLDHTSNSVKLKKDNVIIQTGSYTFGTPGAINIKFINGDFRMWDGSIEIFTGTYTGTYSGSIQLKSAGGNNRINEVKIFTRV